MYTFEPVQDLFKGMIETARYEGLTESGERAVLRALTNFDIRSEKAPLIDHYIVLENGETGDGDIISRFYDVQSMIREFSELVYGSLSLESSQIVSAAFITDELFPQGKNFVVLRGPSNTKFGKKESYHLFVITISGDLEFVSASFANQGVFKSTVQEFISSSDFSSAWKDYETR